MAAVIFQLLEIARVRSSDNEPNRPNESAVIGEEAVAD